MQRIETNNFILTQNVLDANGDCTWLITQKSNAAIFYIHVFASNRLNIKLFNKSHIKNPSEAIAALCEYLILETNTTPCINIHDTNKSLIAICTKAGFRKVKNIKHLYTFKIKSTS